MESKKLTRRDFIKKAGQATALAAVAPMVGTGSLKGPFLRNPRISDKVLVLGFDGMDPQLLKRFVAKGKMPGFKRLMERGYFGPLQTTQPPQSPVAWASFITGTNPGGHGIYDFIHRDPATFTPHLSTTRSHDADRSLSLGEWQLPLEGGRVELLRGGTAFWRLLEERDIFASLFQLPSNFPVESGSSSAISGMGTPDLLGSYGTFTYITDAEVPGAKDFTGGRVVQVRSNNHAFSATVEGPPNSFFKDGRKTEIELTVHRDPWENVARITIENRQLVMKKGEWSEWIPIRFELMPMFASVGGMVRLYLQEVHPHLRLYLSPINIDPNDPILPICNPDGYSRELSEMVGRFYTQGFPEDTKALSHGVFSDEEFLTQTRIAFEERIKAFDYQFSNFQEGMLFFYFSTVDLNTHMMWRTMDPSHPLYEPNASPMVKHGVEYFYRRLDDVVRQVLDRADSRTTIMVVSDHGFVPFVREVNLSTWLVENGFTAVSQPKRMEEIRFYNRVDWPRTKAYALGINGIYINVEGRDRFGSVKPHQVAGIKQEIIQKLKKLRDPANGKPVVLNVYDSEKLYSGPYVGMAPDIVVGYNNGYRISDEAVLGQFPKEIIRDRVDKWSSDHCMDWSILPGVLLTNREVAAPQPALWDLAPTILDAFGIPTPATMDGRPIFKT